MVQVPKGAYVNSLWSSLLFVIIRTHAFSPLLGHAGPPA